MVIFTQQFVKHLYTAGKDVSDVGFLYFVLPKDVEPQDREIPFTTALTSTGLAGSFVFAGQEPVLDDKTAQAFVDSINKIIEASPTQRAIIWLNNPFAIAPGTVCIMGLNDNGSVVRTDLVVSMVPGLTLRVQAGMNVSMDDAGNTVLFKGSGRSSIQFEGSSTPLTSRTTLCTLPFSGAYRGCFQFSLYIERLSLYKDLHWGFQFQFPAKNPGKPEKTEWVPLASGGEPGTTDNLGFSMSIDPTDILNTVHPDRTYFQFTGRNLTGALTILASYYMTIYGTPVNLLPATNGQDISSRPPRLVFSVSRDKKAFYMCPDGDFILGINNSEDGKVYDLTCGFSGTEYIGFQPKSGSPAGYPGDRLRFFSRKPAYASFFPFKKVSPVGPPVNPGAKLLDPLSLTSWATVIPATGTVGVIPYIAQPGGASLYGRDSLIFKNRNTLLGHMDPGIVLSGDDLSFPLVPYAGINTEDGITTFLKKQIKNFERQVIAPTRRNTIGDAASCCTTTQGVCVNDTEDSQGYNAVTPHGLLTTVNQEGKWTKILLCRNITPAEIQMYFSYPDTELQQAFQTSQLFLVAANAAHLGNLTDNTTGTDPAFVNKMNIGNWYFSADVGRYNKYNNYNNIIIIKGKKGALFDPASSKSKKESLVSNPDKWTRGISFSAPTTIGSSTPDPDQLVILSQWLSDFFQEASEQQDTMYFQKFNTIARDPEWTGILILKMNIAALPPDMAGIITGVTAPEQFNAHHFGIEISQVQNDPAAGDIELHDSSSLFGLIYYTDPGLSGQQHFSTGDGETALEKLYAALKSEWKDGEIDFLNAVPTGLFNRFFKGLSMIRSLFSIAGVEDAAFLQARVPDLLVTGGLNETDRKGYPVCISIAGFLKAYLGDIPLPPAVQTAAISELRFYLDSIGLSYQTGQQNPEDNGVMVALKGFFSWQSDPVQPMRWDAAKPEQTPGPPGSGNKYLDLRLLAMGQHVTAACFKDADTVEKAIGCMTKMPVPEPGQLSPITFDPEGSWLIGADFGVLKLENTGSGNPPQKPGHFITLQVVFNDPFLYALRIALNGKPAKVFKGLDFQIMYRKISDTVGVYQSRITLPDRMRRISVGAFTVTLPVFAIAVYTNGDFQVDIGFPWNQDFTHSFTQTLH